MSREIELSRGLVAIVDDEDFEWLSAHSWCAKPTTGGKFYAHRGGRGHSIYMHRAIMDAPVGLEVDHADRDTLNNRRENLRICTRSDNCANSANRIGQSGFRGVALDKRNGKWFAMIFAEGKRTRIGSFEDPVHAALARDAAAKEKFGSFAILNFPSETGVTL